MSCEERSGIGIPLSISVIDHTVMSLGVRMTKLRISLMFFMA